MSPMQQKGDPEILNLTSLFRPRPFASRTTQNQARKKGQSKRGGGKKTKRGGLKAKANELRLLLAFPFLLTACFGRKFLVSFYRFERGLW